MEYKARKQENHKVLYGNGDITTRMDLSFEEKWESMNDSIRYKRKLESKKIVEFLAWLNWELDNVRNRVLSWRPLLLTGKVFVEMHHKERSGIMFKETLKSFEGSTLLSHCPFGLEKNGPPLRATNLDRGPPRSKKMNFTRELWQPMGLKQVDFIKGP